MKLRHGGCRATTATLPSRHAGTALLSAKAGRRRGGRAGATGRGRNPAKTILTLTVPERLLYPSESVRSWLMAPQEEGSVPDTCNAVTSGHVTSRQVMHRRGP